MNEIKELEVYTAAAKAVAVYKKRNESVFKKYNELLFAASKAEAALKGYVADKVKGNIANKYVRVTYSPHFRKFYEPKVIFKLATPKIKKALLEAKAVVESVSVNSEKFEKLVETGVVPVKIKQAAFREVELGARVLIAENK